jgi:peptide/nickel transport system substrate-binding protein
MPSFQVEWLGSRRGERPRAMRSLRRKRTIAALLLLPALLAACSSASSGTSGKAINGGTVTFALPPGTTPTWIFPFVNSAQGTIVNLDQWQFQMFRPLYFIGTPSTPNIDYSVSLAYPPTYADNNTVVTIRLRNYHWADGTPVTSRNVLFWFNMIRAEKANWWLYVPTYFPDDVARFQTVSPSEFILHLTRPVNSTEFSQNELESITPIPLSWDRTSLSGPAGTGDTPPAGTGAGLDMTHSGVVAVYNFLEAQAKNTATYATSPLWRMVDGPYKLLSFQSTGRTTLTINKAYTGPIKPRIQKIVFLPFTTELSEISALRSGLVDIGYTDYADLNVSAPGYTLAPWALWAFNSMWMNYNNPTVGPLFAQQYIREAMQLSVDQNSIIKDVYKGYAYPSFGTVPLRPPSPYQTKYEISLPYSYNPVRATALLTAHGWAVHPGGTSICSRAGSGPSDCGAGIAAGTPLKFTVLYASGTETTTVAKEVEKSDFSKSGINLQLQALPLDSIFSQVGICTPSQALCKWEIFDFQNYIEGPYPYEGSTYGTGGAYNISNYDSAPYMKLLRAVLAYTGTGLPPVAILQGNWLARNDVSIWQPQPDYQLTEVKSNLRGVVPQSPQASIEPERWYYVGS